MREDDPPTVQSEILEDILAIKRARLQTIDEESKNHLQVKRRTKNCRQSEINLFKKKEVIHAYTYTCAHTLESNWGRKILRKGPVMDPYLYTQTRA